MKEQMDELLRIAEENNCVNEFYQLFYSVMTYSVAMSDEKSNTRIIKHAEWSLGQAMDKEVNL